MDLDHYLQHCNTWTRSETSGQFSLISSTIYKKTLPQLLFQQNSLSLESANYYNSDK